MSKLYSLVCAVLLLLTNFSNIVSSDNIASKVKPNPAVARGLSNSTNSELVAREREASHDHDEHSVSHGNDGSELRQRLNSNMNQFEPRNRSVMESSNLSSQNQMSNGRVIALVVCMTIGFFAIFRLMYLNYSQRKLEGIDNFIAIVCLLAFSLIIFLGQGLDRR